MQVECTELSVMIMYVRQKGLTSYVVLTVPHDLDVILPTAEYYVLLYKYSPSTNRQFNC